MESLKDKLKDFDYVRVSFPDINGIYLSRLYPTRLANELITGKCGLYSGAVSFGSNNEIILVPEVVNRYTVNAKIILIPETFHPIPWTNKDEMSGYRTCEILCEFLWTVEKSLIEAHPRVVARRQLERLENLGFHLYSAFEPEMTALQINTLKPLSEKSHMFSGDLIAQRQAFFIDLDRMLIQLGIKLRYFDTEYGKGQLEMPLEAEWGIKAADDAFFFRQAAKEIGRNHGIDISFMSVPGIGFLPSGFHYNHSLWSKSDRKGILHDDKTHDQLSQTAKYWLGGLLKHAKSLTVFCSPTVNCYRRLFTECTPNAIYWRIDDRVSTFRAIVEDEKGTYFENRLPSAASNPYLVLAATVAAGIDGIINKIQPPPAGSKELGELPGTLSEAINCLEEDSVIKEALGQQFISWFLRLKKESDLKHLGSIDPKLKDEANLEKERKHYFDFL